MSSQNDHVFARMMTELMFRQQWQTMLNKCCLNGCANWLGFRPKPQMVLRKFAKDHVSKRKTAQENNKERGHLHITLIGDCYGSFFFDSLVGPINLLYPKKRIPAMQETYTLLQKKHNFSGSFFPVTLGHGP